MILECLQLKKRSPCAGGANFKFRCHKHFTSCRPQTQGCVERGNGDLQVKLGKWLDEHGGTWSSALQYVTHAINTSTSATTKATPYEIVFGQRPRKDFFVLQELANQGHLHEDEIGPEIFEDEAAHESQVNDGEDEPSQVEDEDGQPEPDIPTAPHPCTPQRQKREEPLNFYRNTRLLQQVSNTQTGFNYMARK